MPPINDFIDNPFEFGQKHPIQARGRTYIPDVTQKAAGTETFGQVKAQQRISWFNLVYVAQMPHFGKGGFQIEMKAFPENGFEPAYWLPWAPDKVYRITLRPSKKALATDEERTKIGVQQFRQIVRDPMVDPSEKAAKVDESIRRLALGAEGTDTRIFFTAAVNGCSVYVEGPEDAPTVYHANAMSHGGSFEKIDYAYQYRELEDRKTAFMDERYRKISTSAPKLARTGDPGTWGHGAAPGNEAGRVTMKEYLVPAVGVGSLNNDRAQAIEAWRQRYGFTTKIDGEPKIEDVIGTIFGKKQDSGKWEFYYQKLMCVSALFWDPVKRSLTPKCEWQVISCSKFWPGAGHAFLRAL